MRLQFRPSLDTVDNSIFVKVNPISIKTLKSKIRLGFIITKSKQVKEHHKQD